jgi:hypothetical protein
VQALSAEAKRGKVSHLKFWILYIYSVDFKDMSKNKKFDFEKIKGRATELRINMTESEKTLWKELRDRKLSGVKFLRQHVILYKGNLKRYKLFCG